MIWSEITAVTRLRLYELFVGPPELDAEWDDRGIDGVYRFITRFWKLVMEQQRCRSRRDKGTGKDPSPYGLRYHNPSGELQFEYRYFRFHGI